MIDLPVMPADLRPSSPDAKRSTKTFGSNVVDFPASLATKMAQHAGKGVSSHPDDLPRKATPEEIKAALEHVSADPYDNWWRVLAIIRRELGDEGKEIARAWSATSRKHKDHEFQRKWQSSEDVTEIGVGTLFTRIAGWWDDHDLRGLCRARDPIIDGGARIGRGTRIWHFTHVCGGAMIGEYCVLGQNVFVGNRVKIGNGVKIQNNVSIYDGVTLEDGVFCGPSMVFTNVLNPRAGVERKDEYRPTLVQRAATLGANCTILCGVVIGASAMIGAGAVVTANVPAHALMAGVPARRIGWVSHAGEILGPDLICSRDRRAYELLGPEILTID